MPAVTFRQSTAQISQNCGVFQASSTCTSLWVTRDLSSDRAGGVQPAGRQPAGADAEAEGAHRHQHEIERPHGHQGRRAGRRPAPVGPPLAKNFISATAIGAPIMAPPP